MTFYVLATRSLQQQLIGPYRSFKRAEGDAKAWDGIHGWKCCVLPTSPKFLLENSEGSEIP